MSYKEYTPPVSFSEVIERIKDIISKEYNRSIYDKDVAEALGMSDRGLRIYKSTNSYPYTNIFYFCMKYDVSVDWMLFDKKNKIK